MIKKIVAAAIRSGIPAQDVQVLAPMYRGPAGIDQINQLMQDLINPSPFPLPSSGLGSSVSILSSPSHAIIVAAIRAVSARLSVLRSRVKIESFFIVCFTVSPTAGSGGRAGDCQLPVGVLRNVGPLQSHDSIF